jgi:hypothetical protein
MRVLNKGKWYKQVEKVRTIKQMNEKAKREGIYSERETRQQLRGYVTIN